VLLLRVLDAYGYEREAEHSARRALDMTGSAGDSVPAGGRRPSALADYAACLLENGGYRRLYDRFDAVEIFGTLVEYQRRIPDNEIVRLVQNLEAVKTLFRVENGSQTQSPDNADRCVREVYQTVSTTRAQVASNEFFAREDAYEMSGLEPGPAMNRLLDDVVSRLRSAENELFHLTQKDTGLYVSAVVLNERAVLDQKIETKWTIGTRSEPVEIRSAEIVRAGSVEPLIKPGEGTVVRPGAPLTLTYYFPAHFGVVNKLEPVYLTLALQDGHGRRMRYNVLRSIYLEQPVQITAEFPYGKVLRDLSIPIEVRIVKKTGAHVEFQAGWYSPAGLQLKEGNALRYTMTADQDSAAIRVNVLVPNPCRPGSFPFKFKFFGNGKDLGTISSSLFKPYQWLFIGPFESSQRPLETQYPPERSVELHDSYAGRGRRIGWQILSDDAHNDAGAVVLGGSLIPPGVGYLYTVIESSTNKRCPVFLTANAPAAVFINGARILTHEPSDVPYMANAEVEVKQGLNNILIKVLGDKRSWVFFKLGDDDNLSSDEFSNNLWELVGGFSEFHEKSQSRLTGVDDVQKLVTLRYEDRTAHSVSVIGTFNGWSPEYSRMRQALDGTWEITLSLRPGKYAYRFLINNRKQVLDPNSVYEEPDGYGGKNSVIFVMK
jgi:hypothetical protein